LSRRYPGNAFFSYAPSDSTSSWSEYLHARLFAGFFAGLFRLPTIAGPAFARLGGLGPGANREGAGGTPEEAWHFFDVAFLVSFDSRSTLRRFQLRRTSLLLESSSVMTIFSPQLLGCAVVRTGSAGGTSREDREDDRVRWEDRRGRREGM